VVEAERLIAFSATVRDATAPIRTQRNARTAVAAENKAVQFVVVVERNSDRVQHRDLCHRGDRFFEYRDSRSIEIN